MKQFLLAMFCFGILSAGMFRYPYLQPTNDMNSTIGIAWQADKKSGGKVFYGIKSVYEHSAEGVYQGKSSSNKERYYVMLKGLQPGKRYKYMVSSDGTQTKEYSFLTSCASEIFSYKVLILSDTHIACDGQISFEKALPEFLKYKPDLILIIGDVIDWPDPKGWDKLFDIGRDLWANAVFCPVAGNHDAQEGSLVQEKDTDPKANFRLYAEQFYFPENGPESVIAGNDYYKKLFYSYSYGGVFYVAVGAGYINFLDKKFVKDGDKWLESVMEPAQKKNWNIIAMDHVNTFAASIWWHYKEYIDILNKYPITIHLSGHGHFYRRDLPSIIADGKFPNPTSKDKEKYVNTGGVISDICTSLKQQLANGDFDPAVVVAANGIGYQTMNVSKGGSKLEVTAYLKQEGTDDPFKQIDHYTVETTKKSAPKASK